MIELERCFLAKSLPQGLENCSSKEIIDVYIPKEQGHAAVRIRKQGDRHFINKKLLVSDDNAHEATEQTVDLDEHEFNILSQAPGKRIHKKRYNYEVNGITAEVDVFQGALKGLVMIDFEFKSQEEFDNFKTPDFCLVDIKEGVKLRHIFAGGVLCGKSYEDVQEALESVGYKRIE